MTSEKPFDCIEYKRAVQCRHVAETQGISDRQKTERRQRWLKESDHPAARLWREMNAKQELTATPDAGHS
jgi:hypothetical protein